MEPGPAKRLLLRFTRPLLMSIRAEAVTWLLPPSSLLPIPTTRLEATTLLLTPTGRPLLTPMWAEAATQLLLTSPRLLRTTSPRLLVTTSSRLPLRRLLLSRQIIVQRRLVKKSSKKISKASSSTVPKPKPKAACKCRLNPGRCRADLKKRQNPAQRGCLGDTASRTGVCGTCIVSLPYFISNEV